MSDAAPHPYTPRNPVGRRRSDILRDRALWLLVVGALFNGGAAAILVRQLDREERQRDAERGEARRHEENLLKILERERNKP